MTQTTSDDRIDHRMPARRRATFVAVCLATVIAVARDLAQSNARALFDAAPAPGLSELPVYLVTGVIAYLGCLPGLILLRRRPTAQRSGRIALVYGLLALLPFLLDYWTALPVTFGAFAVMAGWDAGARRPGRAGLVLGGLAIAVSIAALVYRMAGGTFQVGS